MLLILGLLAAVGTTSLLALPSRSASAAPPAPPPARRSPVHHLRGTNRLIVRLGAGTGGSTLGAVHAASAAGVKVAGARVLSRTTSVVLTLPERLEGNALDAAITAVAAEPGVVSVEPSRRMYASSLPNDPYYSDQWNLRANTSNNYGANVAPGWDVTTGSADVVVAVIDTGITDHPDLDGRVLPGYDFISDLDTANDGDGRDSDAHDPGDWIAPYETVAGAAFAGCTSDDSSWHGSHVAGIIAATGNNSIGIAGVDWGVKILPLRVLGKCGGDNGDVIDAMRWAVGIDISGVPHNANPAKVVNISLGGRTGSCSFAMQQAINDVIAAGAVVVTAAGNDGEPASTNEPGNCSGVINVAATGKYGERASYSNYGSAVTLAAPGGGDFDWGIRSTVNASKTSPTVGTYRNFQGTSMAAPHVAGAVSLLLSLSPTLTPTQTRTVLTSSATAFPATGTYSTCSGRCGAGVLNVQAALILAGNLRPPGVPTALQAIAAPGSVTLSWEAPVDTGGTDIVDYRIQRSTNGGLSWATVRDSTSPLAGATITGLTNGITYTFRVAAINRVTVGDWSLSAAATPATVPGRARSFVARRGDQRVSLSWRKPISTGGAAIQHYSIEESTDGVQWNEIVQVPGTSTATTVLGLTNGVRYRFRVTAVNQAGAGTRSTLASATPLSVPGVPGNLDGTPTNRSVALTWTAPLTDGGTRITRYIVQRSRDGGSTWTTLLRGTSVNPAQLVKYLENGRDYVFRVSARNSLGRGPWSIPFTTRPRTTASAPLAVTVNAGNGEVAVSWSAPKSTGGSEITAYQIEVSTDGLTWSPAGTTADGAARSFTASALVNDTSYRFRVAAVNAAGTGSFSDPRTATPHA